MHFTYQPANGDLEQGDVLARTPEIEAVLQEVHPHYRRADYWNLMVLTQSCDLVVRSPGGGPGRCKARYVTVAAVRPLQTALNREVRKHQRSEREKQARYCRSDARQFVRQFVERLLNNNEPGYFYLHDDPDSGLDAPRVAFLALSIALKSELHYEKLRAARIAQLKPEFQAKLGQLVGNMYSRVGTTDWWEHIPQADFEKMVDDKVERLCNWVDDAFITRIAREEKRRKKADATFVMTEDHVLELVATWAAEREARNNLRARRAADVLRELGLALPDEAVAQFENRLVNDGVFSGFK